MLEFEVECKQGIDMYDHEMSINFKSGKYLEFCSNSYDLVCGQTLA